MRTRRLSDRLVSYGVSYYEGGRLSAQYIQRISRDHPANLPAGRFSKFGLAVNPRTARELNGIPQSVLFRADKVIE